MQLNVPVHQTITLPDEWQACKTPQELSYWLIAKLDGIQAAIDALSGGGDDLTELQEQVTALQTKVDALNSRVAGLTQTTVDVQGGIEENKTNIATNTTNIATLRTDLQTTNENLSGVEDRVNTNSASIVELQTRQQWYIKRAFIRTSVNSGILTATFDYFSTSETVPSSFTAMCDDILSNPNINTQSPVIANGSYNRPEQGQAAVTRYLVTTQGIQFTTEIGGNTEAVTLLKNSTQSVTMQVQPLG